MAYGVAGTQDSIVFQYSLDATSISTGTWTNYVQLNFKAPITTGTAGALNGNVAPNRSLRTSTITALNIPNGAKIWFRWSDINVAGTDHSLAIDDFSISTTSALLSLQPN
ncbi:MAG: hypothetical protein IPN87_17190 [Saprospiraceae bacterium]|nr:hypothetical protein [Candidatus Brachybacter algidus]